MNTTSYCITLDRDEEKLAQLLTRDAWLFFSQQISDRETFHIKEIPMMPRRGMFEIANDAELIQYYVDHASDYAQELALIGWESDRIKAAAERFVSFVEKATGILRGTDTSRVGLIA